MEGKAPPPSNSYAETCLQALAATPLGGRVSLGGAFGLSHYHAFRTTHDVDAWWTDDVTAGEQGQIIDLLRKALDAFGTTDVRRHGDVVSVELVQDRRTVFSFQIARRSARLAALEGSPWPPVHLDSLRDLIAAKMAALIQRGAPRDFLDIFELCRVRQTTVAECWRLWWEREELRGVVGPDARMAREALLLHLTRIAVTRPLEAIADERDRQRAVTVREWFRHEFIAEQRELD